MNTRMKKLLLPTGWALMLIASGATYTSAQPTSDPCADVTCENLQRTLCSNGFSIALTNYVPAATSDNGEAVYTYLVCAPAFDGVCSNNGASCQDHQDCSLNCNGPTGSKKCAGTAIACTSDADCAGTCSGDCRTDHFQGLSHFDVEFPQLGATGSCLSAGTDITITCSKGTPVEGDAACYGAGSGSDSFVAKCDAPNLSAGECLTMTVKIPGESSKPGLGATVLADKEGGRECTYSCLAGPSCDSCDPSPPPGDTCITRTRGFWGTHPHLIAGTDTRSLNLLPIDVCGAVVSVTPANACSTSEALCTSANDLKSNPEYLSLAAQLTAAKLNLQTTAAVSDGGSCAAWSFGGKSIEEWITYCESNYCDASKAAISGSGCIQALDDFNNSEDILDEFGGETPSPFDRPGPAMTAECQRARGNKKYVDGDVKPCKP